MRDHRDEECGNFFMGIINALTITALIAVVIAILWLMMSTAFADTRPDACAQYRGAEVVACINEARK